MAAASSAAPSIPRSCWATVATWATPSSASTLPLFWNVSQVQFYGFTDGAELFTREPSVGFPSWNHAASAGAGVRLGWFSSMNADLTVAKAIDGPRDDTRFFFAVTGKY